VPGADTDRQEEGRERRQDRHVLRVGAQHLFGQLHQVIEAARHLQGGRGRHHRQDDQHDGDRRLGGRTAEAQDQQRDAQAADQAECDTASADTDKNGTQYEHKLDPEHCHDRPPRMGKRLAKPLGHRTDSIP